MAAVYLTVVLAIGLWISTLVDTQQQAMFVTFFVMMIYLLMSGLFTPVDSMPPWVQVMSEFTPVRHFVAISRAILVKGAGLAEIARPLADSRGLRGGHVAGRDPAVLEAISLSGHLYLQGVGHCWQGGSACAFVYTSELVTSPAAATVVTVTVSDLPSGLSTNRSLRLGRRRRPPRAAFGDERTAVPARRQAQRRALRRCNRRRSRPADRAAPGSR